MRKSVFKLNFSSSYFLFYALTSGSQKFIQMKFKRILSLALGSGIVLGFGAIEAPNASAALLTSYQFNGNGNWSLDGVGSNINPVGNISAFVPVGSRIEKAFLYSSTNLNNNSFVPNVNFDGTTYSGAAWTNLGSTSASSGSLTAFRTDVTNQVAAKVGTGSPLEFIFSVLSENPSASIDGEALAIVYSNPNELERTIAFLDGFTNPLGDTTSVNLADPLTSTQLSNPNFEALLSLGIGFSAGGASGQFSRVDVNGSRLTTAAGGADDGGLINGGLITIGGLGDSTGNPLNPNSNTEPDDELYSIKSFLAAGNTQIQIDTLNPSNDDNIFFAGINITARAGVNAPPPSDPTAVPEPFTIVGTLIGAGTAFRMRKRLKATNKL
ncbi:PEP-CTERM putative exosortase interaction domain-containing protein [Chamaesiphon minutus PCC 6605]|uniref:PEP-CTERM putative exosortase interaction domain-containing protein n=2 Tax=Chamaesiphon TaxID=217161 RepID=K9UNF4_CHAP6|nr:PEP-CTERM putative exosortase interaction domain-containing protein [Chamaesiphon minutus PCC 6605]